MYSWTSWTEDVAGEGSAASGSSPASAPQVGGVGAGAPSPSEGSGGSASGSPGSGAGVGVGAAEGGAAGPGAAEEDVQLLQCIGNGSHGSVYRGVWRYSPVAVKVLTGSPTPSGLGSHGGSPSRLQRALDPELVRRAEHEALLGVRLRHPNLLPTLTALKLQHNSPGARPGSGGPDLRSGGHALHTHPEEEEPEAEEEETEAAQQGEPEIVKIYIVMEYCTGPSLRQALDRRNLETLDEAAHVTELLGIASDVCSAVLHMHCQGVVHGDLKASNVLLTTPVRPTGPYAPAEGGRRFTAKVADFGQSVVLEEAAGGRGSGDGDLGGPGAGRAGVASTCITLSHGAPELFQGSCSSYASDTYAVGVLLWELWTGNRPYKQYRTAAEVLHRKGLPGSTSQDLGFSLPDTPRSRWLRGHSLGKTLEGTSRLGNPRMESTSSPGFQVGAGSPGSCPSAPSVLGGAAAAPPPAAGGAGSLRASCHWLLVRLCQDCWADEPEQRPTMQRVLERVQELQELLDTTTGALKL